MDEVRCPHCANVLPMQELHDGWCETCGKKLPNKLAVPSLGLDRGRVETGQSDRREREQQLFEQGLLLCNVCWKRSAIVGYDFPMSSYTEVMFAALSYFLPTKYSYTAQSTTLPSVPCCQVCRWRARAWRVYALIVSLELVWAAFWTPRFTLACFAIGLSTLSFGNPLLGVLMGLLLVLGMLFVLYLLARSVDVLGYLLFRRGLRKKGDRHKWL